jgi:hypothetical protein
MLGSTYGYCLFAVTYDPLQEIEAASASILHSLTMPPFNSVTFIATNIFGNASNLPRPFQAIALQELTPHPA